MVYLLAALLPPVGLLLNGQPLSAILNLIIIVPCIIVGLIFPLFFLIPSLHAIIAVYMKREDRKHREIVDAIERARPAARLAFLIAGASSARRLPWSPFRDGVTF
jgi:hypothetical protein